MPHQLCWLLTHQPQLRRSIACRTWQKFPKVKKEKKKKKEFSGWTHVIAVVITFFLLSSHVIGHLPVLLKFSQSTLPFYFISFSCFESHYHHLFFFYIMWWALGLWATWHLMWIYCSVLKLETTFWNFKFQLYMLSFVNKNNVFNIIIIIISFFIVIIQVLFLYHHVCYYY